MLFRDLKAYQHALRVAALSRPLIKRLPASEHDLADQWRRASNSVALNLAEGVTRKGSKEFRRFTDICAWRLGASMFAFLCRVLHSSVQDTVQYFY